RTGDRAVHALTLEAYPGFTERVMEEIEADARARFDIQDALAVHRWGTIDVGEPVIFVAVAAAHRRPAFEAADFLMDHFKIRAPFWKREDGPDGRRWIEPRDQDHADLARWAEETP
ncbi:MAG: molybdenum cofactor biosynthesis protein MoaE, partial [Brevundimonas sp.]